MFIRALFTFLVLYFPISAYADCADLMNGWIATLHPGRTSDADKSLCKIWPQNPAQTIAVLLLPQKETTENGDEAIYDVEVLVADSEKGTIIAHLYEESAISSDAIVFQGFGIDTARWQLTPQVLAFGVSQGFGGSSRVNPYAQTTLSLYVMDGHTLRKVLEDLATDRSNGDWDGDCAGTFSHSTVVLSVGTPGQGGYATLRAHQKSVNSTQVQRKKDCVTKDKPAIQSNVTLSYDGMQYVIPDSLKAN